MMNTEGVMDSDIIRCRGCASSTSNSPYRAVFSLVVTVAGIVLVACVGWLAVNSTRKSQSIIVLDITTLKSIQSFRL